MFTTCDWSEGQPHKLHVYLVVDKNEQSAVVARTIAEALWLWRERLIHEFGCPPEETWEPNGGVSRIHSEVIVKHNYYSPSGSFPAVPVPT